MLLDGIRASISHNGSRIVFSPDHGQMYVSLGDAFDPELAQDLSQLNGKILRINVDGSIPADNPFHGSPVWSYGFPRVEGWCDTPDEDAYCRDHAVTLPLKTWSPTYGISGIAWYDHAAIPE